VWNRGRQSPVSCGRCDGFRRFSVAVKCVRNCTFLGRYIRVPFSSSCAPLFRLVDTLNVCHLYGLRLSPCDVMISLFSALLSPCGWHSRRALQHYVLRRTYVRVPRTTYHVITTYHSQQGLDLRLEPNIKHLSQHTVSAVHSVRYVSHLLRSVVRSQRPLTSGKLVAAAT
jgi:hypothetical protein